MPQLPPANQPIDQRTYGNVWTRIWQNQDVRGQVYYTVSQHRLYEREDGTAAAKSFLTSDLEDIIRGCQWASSVLFPSETKVNLKAIRPERVVHRTRRKRESHQ